MRTPLIALLLLCLLIASGDEVARADASPAPVSAGLPAAVPASRYAALTKDSLFAPPTAVVAATPPPPPPPQPTWAEGWKLTSLAEIGTGRYRLALTRSKPSADTKAPERIVVTTGESNSEGIALAGVQWNPQPGQTRVTLNRGGVFAVFNFDPNALLPSAGGPHTAPNPFLPQTVPHPLQQPVPVTPGPRTGGEIPQRAGTRTGPIPGAPPAPPAAPPRVFQPSAGSQAAPHNPAPDNNEGQDD